MKKLLTYICCLIAAILFMGCSKSFEDTSHDTGFELTVVTNPAEARTEYDADLQDITWSAGDIAQVLVKGTYANATAVIDPSDARIASFTWAPGSSISYVTAGTRIVQGFAPQQAYASCTYDANGSTRTCATRLGLKLPATQTATTTTFDKAADLLVTDNMSVNITSADLSAGSKTVDNFHFRRMVAISEFTYKVTNSTLTASNEKVESVSFQVISTANDKFIAGNMYVKPTENGAKYVNANDVELSNNKDYFYAEDSNQVTVTLTDQPALKNGFTAWFVTSPVTLAADDKLVFTITTTAGSTITKTISAVGKNLTFSTTKKNTLSVTLDNNIVVDSSTITPTPEGLQNGDYAMLVKFNDSYYAVSSEDASSSRRRKAIVVTNYTEGDKTFTTDNEALIWTLSATSNGFYIKKGSDYLFGTDNQNYAQVGATTDVITAVKQTDGTYQLFSSNNTTDARLLALNSQVGSGEFSFYRASTTSDSSRYADDIILLPIANGSTPEPDEPENPDTPDTPGTEGGVTPALGLSWLEIPATMTGSEMGGVTTSDLFIHTFYYGSETDDNRNYTVCYDKDKLTTYWVAYPLSSAHLGSYDRSDAWAFVSSSLLSEQLQPNVKSGSYRSQSSGGTNNYSRGHLLPSASRTNSSQMNEQTFILINQVPQIQNGFNGSCWMNLESAVRNAINGKTLYVVTGTALQKGNGQTEEIGTMEKTYDRSGKEIAVPRYFYKVILKVNSTTTSASAIGFWFTNESHSSGYESFAVSVDEIEQKLGMDFFPNLSDALETTAERNTSWSTFSNF